MFNKFNEKEYLEANPDVAKGVSAGNISSGLNHYKKYGKKEGRKLLLSREEKAMFQLDMRGFGLEIGPSFNPLAPKKRGYRVQIVDHLNAEELRSKYKVHDVPISNIEEVDYIWHGQSLQQLVGKEAYYDWIIASHVIEHVPDVVSFLHQCYSLLKPDGYLSLIVPDKRFCFDYFNPVSTVAEILDAYHEKRKRPSMGQLYQNFANNCTSNGRICWDDQGGKLELMRSFNHAKELWIKAQESADYTDVHCWRFTPNSFRLIISDLNLLGLAHFSITKEFSRSGCEFFMTLQPGIMDNASIRIKMLAEFTE